MSRTIEYQITESAAGQKISGFLKAKGYSEQNLVNLKKDETSIWLNGVCVHMNRFVEAGDVLRVTIREQDSSEQIRPVELAVQIVYEDDDLMVINKPAGMPIHPSRNNPDNSLGNALAWLYQKRGEPFVFRCINRLDRDTSGLTIVAKNMVSAAILGRMVQQKAQEGGIHREYLAIVDGILDEKDGTVSAPIARKESRNLERVVDFACGERAITHYHVVEEYKSASLVSLVLETGRTHQIRVHMKYLGHPLLGDFLYHPGYAANQVDRVEAGEQAAIGNRFAGCAQDGGNVALEVTENSCGSQVQTGKESCDGEQLQAGSRHSIRRQALHASRLMFTHPMTGEALTFTAPLPDDMQELRWRLSGGAAARL